MLKPKLPILNRAHPLAHGLVGAWLMYEGAGGYLHELINGYRDSHSVPWYQHRALEYDGSNYVQTSHPGVLGTADRTLFARIWMSSSGDQNIVGWGTDGGGQRFDFRTASNELRLEIQGSGTTTSFDVIDSTWHTVGVRVADGTADLIFRDNDFESISLSPNTGTSINMRIGAGVYGPRPLNNPNRIGFTYLYERAMSAAEIRSVVANPYQMFLPQSYNTLAITAAPSPPGTTDIDLAWTDNAEHEDEFSLERRTDGGAWSEIATPAADDESYTDSGVTTGQTYQYRLRALNATKGNSEWAYSDDVTV